MVPAEHPLPKIHKVPRLLIIIATTTSFPHLAELRVVMILEDVGTLEVVTLTAVVSTVGGDRLTGVPLVLALGSMAGLLTSFGRFASLFGHPETLQVWKN